MVLRSYGFFCSEGNWSKYVTIRDAMSGEGAVFLGSVEDLGDLPLTISDAKILWSLIDDPVVGDTAFVNVDSSHSSNPAQYSISAINGDDIDWIYQFSIPIPGVTPPDGITINTNAFNQLQVMNGGITTDKIAPSSVNGQVLKTDSGSVVWSDSEVKVDNVTVDKNSSGAVEVKNLGISTSKLADNSITTVKVVDSSITAAKLANNSVSDVKIVDGNVTNTKLAVNSVSTDKVVDSNITEAKLASNSVSTIKVVDSAITAEKLASNSVTTIKIADNAVTTSKITDKNITPAKLAVGTEDQVLRTVSGEAVWSQEVDISNKADKFTYTPDSGAETLYNLEDIAQFNVSGDGAGVVPNTGVVWTNFAGETVTIPIAGEGAGFFNYKGQVNTYEELPDFSTVANGDLYSIAASINFKGTVAAMEDLPANPDPYDQYFVSAPGEYNYWFADASLPDGGQWKVNHCQFDNGCNDTGFYAFGIGDTPSWNRLDGELSVDQVLNVDSANAIANRAVAQSLITKLDMFSPNTLSEFFNENDGGGLVFKDSSARELAGITLNTDVPQLYLHRYDGAGDLTDRVLFEIHEDGAYISTTLTGTSWTRIATIDDIHGSFEDYVTETEYNKNTILRDNVVDTTTYNRYGFSAYDFESTTFTADVDSLYIDELVVMKELNDSLQYCIDEYFPSPPRSA
jgi:hypothetical protein